MAAFYVPGGNCGKNFSHLHPDSMKGNSRSNPKPVSLAAEGYLPSNGLYRYACNPPIVTKGEVSIPAKSGRVLPIKETELQALANTTGVRISISFSRAAP